MIHVVSRPFKRAEGDRRRVAVLTESGKDSKLHLRVLVQNIVDTVNGLYRWKLGVLGTTKTVQVSRLALGNAPSSSSSSEHPLILPVATDLLEPRPEFDSNQSAICALPRDGVVCRILGRLSKLEGEHPAGVPLQALRDVDLDTIRGMESTGALSVIEEGGSLRLRQDLTSQRFTGLNGFDDPKCLLFITEQFNTSAKLDIIALISRGWKFAEGGDPPPYTQGASRTFVRAFS